MTSAESRSSTTQAVRKAVGLLKCFTESRQRSLAIGELARITGWSKSSVSRLMSALHDAQLVRRDEDGRYSPGVELIALAGAALAGDTIYEASHAQLALLAADTGETANLSVIDRGELLTLDEVASPQALKLSGWIGARHPLHGSSSGKVLLAALSEEELAIHLRRKLKKIGPRTKTNKVELRRELERVRAKGYALNVDELSEGLTSAAAPVRDHTGRAVAAISVAGPSFRLRARELERAIARVVRAAAEASKKLGHRAREE